MIVLDTHAWVWWVGLRRKLSRPALRAIERAATIGISAISVLEIAELAERKRMELDSPTRAWVRAALSHQQVELLPLSAEVAVDAAQLHFAADPFDRIIYATARAEDAQLVTRDERLHTFDPDRAIW